MIATILTALLASTAFATPINVRKVDALNEEAFKEAQQRDDTATRAFSDIEIKTSDGQCLFVDELSGDFRANLTPIQLAACDGSAGQKWDVITAGKHNDQPGNMLIVSTLTQGCMNFDPRRAAGSQVILFSCGGRADGGGAVTNSQLFPFSGGAGPLSISPVGDKATCFTAAGAVVGPAACSTSDNKQSFTFGAGGAASPVVSSVVDSVPASSSSAPTATTAVEAPAESPAVCVTTREVVVTRFVDVTGPAPSSVVEVVSTDIPANTIIDTSAAVPTATDAPAAPVTGNPTTPVPVSRAGGILRPTDAAESHKRDDTATRALTGVSIKDASGKCLFIDPTAGDFRQNLIPIAVQDCTGSAGEKFDFITKGVHNDQVDETLIVSSLMNGCLNLDVRRAAGDQVLVFSCGGRADGEGGVQAAQLFPFKAGQTSLPLAPVGEAGKFCFVNNGGKLDSAACTGAADQVFTVG